MRHSGVGLSPRPPAFSASPRVRAPWPAPCGLKARRLSDRRPYPSLRPRRLSKVLSRQLLDLLSSNPQPSHLSGKRAVRRQQSASVRLHRLRLGGVRSPGTMAIPGCGWQSISPATPPRAHLQPRFACRPSRRAGKRCLPHCRCNCRAGLCWSSERCCSGQFGRRARISLRRPSPFRFNPSSFRNTRLKWRAWKNDYIAQTALDFPPHSAFPSRSRTEPPACQN